MRTELDKVHRAAINDHRAHSQEPVQVHNHIYGGQPAITNGGLLRMSLTVMGALTVGAIAYSAYQGQSLSTTIGQIESWAADKDIKRFQEIVEGYLIDENQEEKKDD